ncbi:tigger transposable element-derived protein 4 [Trichonephila inaurata madagascariensis]|uniref:Tigger transposable element-derived protein 4 n=1 Tax=Trichonephila inaurata madagascariensis TaxID=2747483 RepID=A0A8X6WQ45_9ARAC|nr:tigger transposable element-derived protein 4 [Trichonephila inaurata madagascariensis]
MDAEREKKYVESEKKKIPREVLPLEKRIRVIEGHNIGLSQRQLAEKFSCGKTQISNILKNKGSLLKEWKENNGRKGWKRKRKSAFENVNVLVLEFYKRAVQEGMPVSGIVLQEKAREYAEALNLPVFKASNGWLDSFKRRHSIVCTGASGESDANSSKITENKISIPSITEGYDPQDIYNLGETGLLFRALPDRTLIELGKKCRGGKLSNERLTIGFCCSSVGEKEIPVIVTKCKEPKSFKEADLNSLGIKHKHNEKAWMTSEILEEWLQDLNERMKTRKKKILLLIDYAPCHPDEITLSNIAVRFLPPNPLSPLQPLDQGIIQSFKILYRKNMLKRLLSHASDSEEISSLAKKVTLFDAVQLVKHAWNEVSSTTIQKCFSACGLSLLIIHNDNEEESNLSELRLLCEASQISDCVFHEDVEFCEDMLSDLEDESEAYSSTKEIVSESSESEKEEELATFQPFSTSEAFEAIGRLRATFKAFNTDNISQINEKLDFLENTCTIVNEEHGFTTVKDPMSNPDLNFDSKKSESEPCDARPELKNMEGDFSDTASFSSISSDKKPCELNANLQSIKQEVKLLNTHFASMKQIAQFLEGITTTFGIEGETIEGLLRRILDATKEFVFSSGDLEYGLTLVENTISPNKKTEEYLKVLKLKENMLSKMLGCYSTIVTIFQTLTQKRSSEFMSKTEKNQDLLRQQLKGKTNTMESYKSTLEETRAELVKQLSYKETQIQYLNAELNKLSNNKNNDKKDELLEIIEHIKNNALAEKTALKKALKVQRLQSEKAEQSLLKSEKELKEKEKMLFDIAAQRDQLKLHLTIANNSIIEGKNQVEEIRHQNLKLQNELSEKEVNFKKELQRLTESLNEKSSLLDNSVKDKIKLEKKVIDVTADVELARKELKTLKSKLSDPNILSHNLGVENHGNALVDVKQLILLLQSTQEQLKNIKSSPTSWAGGDNLHNENSADQVHKILLKAVEEIKQHLLELKNYCSNDLKENKKSELEIKLKELQKSFSACSKENEALKAEIEELKISKSYDPVRRQNENYSRMTENDLSVKTLQMELKMKNEENWRLKQREKDLERQLEEVKDKLQKKEIENFKLFSLEEELKSRKNELALLEKKKEEESDRLLNRIKELQNALDEITGEHERLKRYVQDLRSSYLNVFGST